MFGYDNVHSLSIDIGDPLADRDLVLWRAPRSCEITRAYVVDNIGLAAGTANYFSVALYNGGTSGTAITALAGTVGGTPAGGTAAAWTVSVPKNFTVSEGTLAEGDYLWARYDETGTVAQELLIQIDYVLGVGA